MKIDLTDPDSLRGATDALQALLDAKTGGFKQVDDKGNPVKKGQKGNDLPMPKKPKKPKKGKSGDGGDKPGEQTNPGDEPGEETNPGEGQGEGQGGGNELPRPKAPENEPEGGEGQGDNPGEEGDDPGKIVDGDPKGKGQAGEDEDDEEEEDELLNPAAPETPEERADRLSRIRKSMEADELEKDMQDMDIDIAKIRDRKKQAEDEAKKLLAAKTPRTLGQLEYDLYSTLKTQVAKKVKYQRTMTRPNASYAGSKFIMPGKQRHESRSTADLVVILDQSNSWDEHDLEKAENIVASLSTFISQGLISSPAVYYFGDGVTTDRAAGIASGMLDSCTTGWPSVMKELQGLVDAHQCTNILILTDTDIERQTNWDKVSNLKVPGCIFWAWRDCKGTNETIGSPTAKRYLIGELGNYNYSI